MQYIDDIIKEAATTNAIGRITWEQRKEIATKYEKHTGENVNINCNACIIKACIKLYNKFNLDSYGKEKKSRTKAKQKDNIRR